MTAKPVAGLTTGLRIRFADLRFPPALPTTRTRYASLSPDAAATEVRRCPLIHPQPLQPGARALTQTQLQGQPLRRSCRVASTLCGLTQRGFGQTETGSHLSDTTLEGIGADIDHLSAAGAVAGPAAYSAWGSRNCQTGGSQAAGRVPCWPKVARQRRERDCCAKLH
jgi:hypothetical protein